MMDLTQIDFRQLFIWVLIWLVGYALGLFEGWIKNKKKKEEEPKTEVVQAPPQILEENYSLAVFESENTVTLKLDKTELEEVGEMNDAQRKRLISLVVKMRPWLDVKKGAAQTEPSTQKLAPAPKPSIHPAYTEYKSQPITGSASIKELEYSKLSMVEQIDWLLQKRLENHPLKSRRIRLQSDLTNSVNFIVGEESYEFIDEIPYPEIKTIIQIAIDEWQNKRSA